MFDVAVIGAGPGGSAAAAALANAGLSVLMVERRALDGEAYRETKPCGGGMDADFFWNLPPRSDASEAVQALSEHRVHTIVAHTRNGPTYEHRSERPIFHLGMRTKIDGWLARRAIERGARLKRDKVRDVHGRKMNGGGCDYYQVEGAQGVFCARYVVGADGAYGVTARGLGLMPWMSVYLASEWECDTDERTWGAWEHKSLLEPSVRPFGYGWIFPKRPRHLSIGWGVPFREARRLNGMTEGLFREHGIQGSITRTAHWIPFYQSGVLASGRGYLVGDAAGLCNPTNGGGIGAAMWSGRMASHCILMDEDGGDSGARHYMELIRARRRYYRLGRAMRNVIIARMALGYRGFVKSSLWDWFIRDLQGELSYEGWSHEHPWRLRLGLLIDPVVEKIIARPGGGKWISERR